MKNKIRYFIHLFKAVFRLSNWRMLKEKATLFFRTVRTDGWKEAFKRVKLFVEKSKISALYLTSQPVQDPVWTPARQYIGSAGIPANSYESHYEDDQDFSSFRTDIKALAFYLPQFHTFPENDEWWGKGFTEWTNTRKAKPQYPSHYQPREPHKDIGYYDLSDYRTLQRQADMMKKHGIYGLCIYHYWFSGKRLMEKPVDLLLEHPEIDLKFCLCWANENWTRAWDGLSRHILISQKHENDDIDYIKDLKKYIMDPRYIRVNGEPLVLVYRPGILPDAAKTFRLWREWAMENGIGKIRILVVRGCANTPDSMLIEGADGEVEFPPAYTAAPCVLKKTDEGAEIMHYPGYVNEIISGRSCTESFTHPVYRGAMLGWDCTPRRKAFHCWYGFSPEWYYRWLRYNISYTRRTHAPEDRFIFINAWNEWAEGTYLEPDELFGYTNLNTTSKALFDLPLAEPVTVEDKIQMVADSPFFDRQWMLENYQDIAVSGMDPVLHYTIAGWKEGRSPSETFPNALYLFFNPEVRQGEVCSLIDFHMKGGKKEQLDELVRKFDALQEETRKKLNIELLIPEAAPADWQVSGKTVAVHLHCFYPDMVPEICGYLKNIPCSFDLFVSIPEGGKAKAEELDVQFKELLPNLGKCDIRVCTNRGRDIAPFICTFGKELLQYDYICHIHTKKSLHSPSHAVWAKYIYEHLFGDAEWMKRLFYLLENGAGILYPADFLMMREEPSGWGSNILFSQQVLNRFGRHVDLAAEFPVIEFPQGSMLWGRSDALRSMLELELSYEDFPQEPLGVDGSVAHALERLFFVWNMGEKGKNIQIFRPGEEELMLRKRYWYKPSDR